MKTRTNRRQFLRTSAGTGVGVLMTGGISAQGTQETNTIGPAPKSASGSVGIPASRGVATRYWIDPSIAAWQPGPTRKVHIEYHTSRHMPKLAERFNADEFGDRLLAAHVNG